MTSRCGCDEYRALSRRGFLGAMSGAAGSVGIAAALGAPAWLPRVTFARDADSSRDTIVSVFLRGGADGLTMCVPFLENNYYRQRPTQAIPRPDSGRPRACFSLDGRFGLPQPMIPLIEAFYSGNMCIVHATGSTDPSRSHVQAQRYIESGRPGDETLFTGWLGRHLATTTPRQSGAAARGLALGPGVPTAFFGGPMTLAVPDLGQASLEGAAVSVPHRMQRISDMYFVGGGELRSVARETINTMLMLERIDVGGYRPSMGAVYPHGPMGYAFKSVAALIKADTGVEAAAIDVTGWDTHSQQGSLDGELSVLLGAVAQCLAAFHADVIRTRGDVTTVVYSEFGRRVAENGDRGTEHGHGNVMFVMGQGIRGGRVLTQWPGLDDLHEGIDLKITIDYRDILAEIVARRLGNPNLAAVFPGYTPTLRGVVR